MEIVLYKPLGQFHMSGFKIQIFKRGCKWNYTLFYIVDSLQCTENTVQLPCDNHVFRGGGGGGGPKSNYFLTADDMQV